MMNFRRRIAAFLVAALAALLIYSVALADYLHNPPPLAGFVHAAGWIPDSPQHIGALLDGAAVIRSSPVIANISTLSAGNEVAVGGSDGIVYVYARNGDILWSKDVFAGSSTPNCNAAPDSRLNSSPAVGDLNNDGVPEVVIGYGTILPSNCDGGIVALNGNSGAVEWRFSLRAWQASQVYAPEGLYGVESTPALADVNGDGTLEVGFAGLDRNMYLLNSNGSVRFYYNAIDTGWSSPAFANIDGDSNLEMIIATDITGNNQIQPPTVDGGYVYAFKTDQRNPTRLEFGTGFKWRTHLDQAMYSSPTIADVLSGNPGLEIVIGSSCVFPLGSSNKTGKWVKILRLSDGVVLQTLDAPACLRSSPAVADIDNDGKLDVVATVTGRTDWGGDGTSKVVAWDPETGAQKWTFVPRDANGLLNENNTNDPNGDDIQSPVIADLDGNGSLEVVVANQWTVHVIRGDNGQPLTCQFRSCPTQQLSLWAWYTVKSTPAIGDLDGDGHLEVVIGGGHNWGPPGGAGAHGLLYVWTDFAAAGLGSRPTNQPHYAAPWPMFRGNAQRTGVVAHPSMAASPTAMSIFQPVGSATTLSTAFKVINNGGGILDWRSSTTGGIQLTPSHGSTSSLTGVTVQVSVPTAGNGTYFLGTITLSSGNGDNSPVLVTLTRHVGPLTFLPLISP